MGTFFVLWFLSYQNSKFHLSLHDYSHYSIVLFLIFLHMPSYHLDVPLCERRRVSIRGLSSSPLYLLVCMSVGILSRFGLVVSLLSVSVIPGNLSILMCTEPLTVRLVLWIDNDSKCIVNSPKSSHCMYWWHLNFLETISLDIYSLLCIS